jgi:hypothetical protein
MGRGCSLIATARARAKSLTTGSLRLIGKSTESSWRQALSGPLPAVEPMRLSQRKQRDSQILGMVVFKLER